MLESALRRRSLAVALTTVCCAAGLLAARPTDPRTGAGSGGPLAQAPPAAAAPQDRQGADPTETGTVPPFEFRYLGPASAGRFISAAGVPGDSNVVYLGAASGGVWKTTDGGGTWAPRFDAQSSQAIGALAVAPSNPDVVWAGTGESCVIRPSDVAGDGVYKSTDAGATWTHMGLGEIGRTARIVVHPTDPDVVYTCALGRTTGPQEERGVFKSTDGGETWARVLFVNPDTGCSGLSMDATNPDVLIAGTWEVVMRSWAMTSGGEGSGVFITRDGGATWTRAEQGMPRRPGKIDVKIAPTDSNRMYALIQTADEGSLWRSDDAGATWSVVSWDRTLIGRAGYYIHLDVNPANADEVLVSNSSHSRSLDGGHSFPEGGGCGDCHGIWMDPENPDRWVLTDDLGASITTDHGRSYTRVRLPVGQMYHVAVDHQAPYWLYSNRQDDGTMRGPSASPVVVDNVPSYADDGAGRTPWETRLGGCESGFTIPDPANPDVVWATCYGNKVTRWDARTGVARSIAPSIITFDSPPDEVPYRCHWTAPIAIDPFETEIAYYGCQVVFRTTDRGTTWTQISPDLSRGDEERLVGSGGIVEDNLGQFYGQVVFAIAPSPVEEGLIWAGTNDARVWYTPDDGETWRNVSDTIPGKPDWAAVTTIVPSQFDAATAYVVFDAHTDDDRAPYIFKTSDRGRTWRKISDGLPSGPLGYALSFAENPNKPGMVFAGTGNGLYYSMDDGGTWTSLQRNLPRAPVSWIVYERRYHDLVVSTYGRGLWVLSDITRLEDTGSVDAAAQPAETRLYTPRAGIRLARGGEAPFVFNLAEPPADPVELDILDQEGEVIRTFAVQARAGLNRASWDLRYPGPTVVELRTTPPENPHIWEDDDRFVGRETRPVTHWGIAGAQRAGPIAAPGPYTVRMRVGERRFLQPFVVVKDPKIASPDEDLVASTAAQIRIRDMLDETAGLVNRLEIIRKQIEDLLDAHRGDASLEPPLQELDETMLEVERRLLSRADMLSDDKYFMESYKLYLNLIWLNGQVGLGAGDVAGGADYRPTDNQMRLIDRFANELEAAKRAFAQAVNGDLAAFNRRMEGRLPAITSTAIGGVGSHIAHHR